MRYVVAPPISIHALREEGDLSTAEKPRPGLEISIHALREEGDLTPRKARPRLEISIHALREEGDPTAPGRPSGRIYFYPRPPRGGRLKLYAIGAVEKYISIHALREEGDRMISLASRLPRHFYPRPPRGGRPALALSLACPVWIFLSTPSARRATDVRREIQSRGGISIHALREEGDAQFDEVNAFFIAFLSTPSARRATPCLKKSPLKGGISIHALREEGDRGRLRYFGHQAISIHALREEGDCPPESGRYPADNFYPRPPRGGRLVVLHIHADRQLISIHALREEGDLWRLHGSITSGVFLSTPSARRATGRGFSFLLHMQHFYPRPPRGGRP